MGHDNVWVLDGGLPFGQKKIFRLKNPKRTYQVGNFESKFKPEMVKPQSKF
jgi:3-mercaptopyruvate sulfurtransferase SseA